jgi:hypothetical protein
MCGRQLSLWHSETGFAQRANFICDLLSLGGLMCTGHILRLATLYRGVTGSTTCTVCTYIRFAPPRNKLFIHSRVHGRFECFCALAISFKNVGSWATIIFGLHACKQLPLGIFLRVWMLLHCVELCSIILDCITFVYFTAVSYTLSYGHPICLLAG